MRWSKIGPETKEETTGDKHPLKWQTVSTVNRVVNSANSQERKKKKKKEKKAEAEEGEEAINSGAGSHYSGAAYCFG